MAGEDGMQKIFKLTGFYRFFLLNLFVAFIILLLTSTHDIVAQTQQNKKYYIDENSSYFVSPDTWLEVPQGGDTIFVSSKRTKALRFLELAGNPENPLVIVNDGGQVNINDTVTWGAIVFENCRYIKITGEGDERFKYGFMLAADKCGLAFAESSSDCEAANILINHDGFFGIYAKKDFSGEPPSPYPVFSNLVIHDCFIENVYEGMYLGETISPGMEFKNVRIYNNIVRNTRRESIQIANMVEDVEIYNNTLLNAGLDNLDQQNNIIQIGDNSVAKVYDNILIGAPGCGIISFGKGNNFYSGNFISSCKGIFLDNRNYTDEPAPIVISNNFFSNNIDNGWIIRNMNEINPISIHNNIWDNDINFFKNESGNTTNYVLENNAFSLISLVFFTEKESNENSKAAWNTSSYQNIGAPVRSDSYPLNSDFNAKQPDDNSFSDEQGGSENFGSTLAGQMGLSLKSASNQHIIDLGSEYSISKIVFHDMTNTNYLEFASGDMVHFDYLFSETCEKYNEWIEQEVSVRTRYIRLSTGMNLEASTTQTPVLETKSLASSYFFDTDEILRSNLIINAVLEFNWESEPGIFLYRSVISNQLCVNIPESLVQNFTVEIFNIKGARLLHREFVNTGLARITLDVSEECRADGVYVFRYYNDMGISKSLKFIKTSTE